jgi:hypothetical protein
MKNEQNGKTPDEIDQIRYQAKRIKLMIEKTIPFDEELSLARDLNPVITGDLTRDLESLRAEHKRVGALEKKLKRIGAVKTPPHLRHGFDADAYLALAYKPKFFPGDPAKTEAYARAETARVMVLAAELKARANGEPFDREAYGAAMLERMVKPVVFEGDPERTIENLRAEVRRVKAEQEADRAGKPKEGK